MLNMVIYVARATMMITATSAEDENLSLMLQSDCTPSVISFLKHERSARGVPRRRCYKGYMDKSWGDDESDDTYRTES